MNKKKRKENLNGKAPYYFNIPLICLLIIASYENFIDKINHLKELIVISSIIPLLILKNAIYYDYIFFNDLYCGT